MSPALIAAPAADQVSFDLVDVSQGESAVVAEPFEDFSKAIGDVGMRSLARSRLLVICMSGPVVCCTAL